MRKTVKRAVLRVGKQLSVPTGVATSRWRRNRLAILCYHGISIQDEHLWDPRFYISPEILENRFQLLRRERYNVLPLGEAVKRLYDGSLPPRSVALTFDDGCYDFYRRAYPLLRKYELPATVYLTTFYCYHPKPVFNMFCYYLMWKGRESFQGDTLTGIDYTPDLRHEAGRMQAAGDIVAWAERHLGELPARDTFAEDLARRLGVDYNAVAASRVLQLMKPAEVTQLAREGLVDIQLHTHRHRTPRDRALFVREIVDNRRYIREMIGSDAAAVHFCYPSGDHAPEFLPWLAGENVISATTCESGLASAKNHPLLLPRVVDSCSLNDLEFESWISGVSEVAAGRL